MKRRIIYFADVVHVVEQVAVGWAAAGGVPLVCGLRSDHLACVPTGQG